MSGSMVTAFAGLVAALSAVVVSVFTVLKTQAETAKLRAETDKIRLEATEISERLENAEAQLSHQASPAQQSITLYDSRSGFVLFDFESVTWDRAAGELSLASSQEGGVEDILVVARHNANGTFGAWLNKYGYIDSPTVIPASNAAGTNRKLRLRCQVRTRGAEHTFALTLKMVSAAPGKYLGQRRHRTTRDVWTDIDDYFDLPFSDSCRLRFEDRSISAAPSRLEIRNFILTEYEPPAKLMPLAVSLEPGLQRRQLRDHHGALASIFRACDLSA